MADALDPTIVAAVANGNFKSMHDLIMTNAISHQGRINTISETAMGNIIGRMNSLDVEEGLGISAAQRGDLAKQISDLAAAVASMMTSIKGGQTTPPVTP